MQKKSPIVTIASGNQILKAMKLNTMRRNRIEDSAGFIAEDFTMNLPNISVTPENWPAISNNIFSQCQISAVITDHYTSHTTVYCAVLFIKKIHLNLATVLPMVGKYDYKADSILF